MSQTLPRQISIIMFLLIASQIFPLKKKDSLISRVPYGGSEKIIIIPETVLNQNISDDSP